MGALMVVLAVVVVGVVIACDGKAASAAVTVVEGMEAACVSGVTVVAAVARAGTAVLLPTLRKTFLGFKSRCNICIP